MQALRTHITTPVSIAPLAVFRVLFGGIMTLGVIRFAARGWIADLYIEPVFHFTYYGFSWVQPLGAAGMYALFAVMGLAALGLTLGLYYRLSAAVFFLTFTYVELIDAANYLNHYYFVSLIAFLLIWVPANRHFALDAVRKPAAKADCVPAWTINVFKLQIGIVYLFAGLAKLNADWLLDAMPLRLWLPARAHLPVVGALLAEPLTAYVFSWAGALFDLTIVFFLLARRTRPWAYAAVVGFHLCTALLFPIGLFPYLMIGCTLLFFSPAFHERCLAFLRSAARRFELRPASPAPPAAWTLRPVAHRLLAGLLGLHVALQVLVPLRFALYPGTLFWTEQGYRFSWRVMLMEKAGYTVFRVHDPATNRSWEVPNYAYLTPNQEKMMATQPDLMLQFAHFLEREYRAQGLADVAITAESYVTLNGRSSRLFVDPAVDLTTVRPGLGHKTWILPFEDPSRTLAQALAR